MVLSFFQLIYFVKFGDSLRGDVKSPRFLRGSHTSCLSCGVWAAQVKPKSEAKASTNDFNVFALPSRLQNAVIRVYDEAGNLIEAHEHERDFKE